MKYNFKDKILNIPDAEIKNNMKYLELTEEDAIQLWLEDNDYLENEEQQALDKKAKDSKITATIHQAKAETRKEKQPRERKENPIKENIIKQLAEYLPKTGAVDIQVVNVGKLITFVMDGKQFKLDLIQTRDKKKG